MSFNLVTFILVVGISSISLPGFASEVYADIFRKNSTKISLDDLHLNKNETVQVMFTTQSDNEEYIKTRLVNAWLDKGITEQELASYTPTMIHLKNTLVVIARITPTIYDDVIAHLKPQVTEVSTKYLASIGLPKSVRSAGSISSELHQVFSFVSDSDTRVPTAISFLSDSDNQRNEKTLRSAGLLNFERTGNKYITEISRDQLTHLSSVTDIKKVDLHH